MKVLVVDDQPEVLEPLGTIISNAADIDGSPYDVVTMSDHAAAVRRLDLERFDIVVVDMRTDARTDEGMDLVRELAERSAVTIVYTAYASLPDCVRAMRAGAWDYQSKIPDDGSDAYDNLLHSMAAGCRNRREQPDLGRPDPRVRWAHEHLERLVEGHAGRFVAILDGEVVEVGDSYDEVWARVSEQPFLVRPFVFAVPDGPERSA